jgi:glycosyltransferase involved in cell wall biosynthesis
MKLVIISHTPHYRRRGEIVGWGPTIREIDQISEMFGRVVHIAPMHSNEAPGSALAYESRRIRVSEVVPSGGEFFKDKLDILRQISSYARAISHELHDADAVHVRFPANISLVALIVLMLVGHPRRRWLKYGGNWKPVGQEPWSYRLQRWLLMKGWHKGIVTVNGEWDDQPSFVRSFLNPCLTEQELSEGREISANKQITDPVRLIFVGSMDSSKGADRTLHIAARFKECGGSMLLDLVGDGEQRPQFERLARRLGIGDEVTFHGWKARTSLAPLYARAHLMILPSNSEGWPKVLTEAMAYGVVPIASDVSSIPQYLKSFRTGRVCAANDLASFVKSIQEFSKHRQIWKQESENATRAADSFSYTRHCNAVRHILQLPDSGGCANPVTSEAFQS